LVTKVVFVTILVENQLYTFFLSRISINQKPQSCVHSFSPECEDDLAEAVRRGEHVPVLRRQPMHALSDGPRCDVLDCPHCALKRLRQVCPATDHTDRFTNQLSFSRKEKGENNVDVFMCGVFVFVTCLSVLPLV
jgi:hypothetical protein